MSSTAPGVHPTRLMTLNNPATLPIGELFNDRYRVERCIKAGGMGAVYEVVHLQTQRRRALKVMLPSVVADADMRTRFKREATIVAGVESDHIAEVLDAGVDGESGSPFILMELLRGDELGALVDKRGRLPPDEVALYLRQAALGLEKTHAEGIVHRDLKPANLFVTYSDEGTPRLKLLDFGIAKVLGDAKTQQTQGILGTPMYISPEQVHGEAPSSARTDVYALTHIAYTLLVGEAYWRHEEAAAEGVMPLLIRVMRGHTQSARERAREHNEVELPVGFDAWFDKGAATDPNDRFEGPLELANAFAELFALEVTGLSRSVSMRQKPASIEAVPQGPDSVVPPTAPTRKAAPSSSTEAEAEPPPKAEVPSEPQARTPELQPRRPEGAVAPEPRSTLARLGTFVFNSLIVIAALIIILLFIEYVWEEYYWEETAAPAAPSTPSPP